MERMNRISTGSKFQNLRERPYPPTPSPLQCEILEPMDLTSLEKSRTSGSSSGYSPASPMECGSGFSHRSSKTGCYSPGCSTLVGSDIQHDAGLSSPGSRSSTSSISIESPGNASGSFPHARNNQVGTVMLRDVAIVSLVIDGKERLCLAQISNTLLKNFSYNEIHNRRVALGITCVQCTPVQLEILRRFGAMPISSRRCGMITKREAERLVTSFLEEHTPPKLPETFAFEVAHACGWGCKGSFIPSRYNSSRAKCIKCAYCNIFLSPNKFIFHFHRTPESKYHHPDAANFNSWRRHLVLDYEKKNEELNHAWEDVKAMFNGGSRKRLASPCGGSSKNVASGTGSSRHSISNEDSPCIKSSVFDEPTRKRQRIVESEAPIFSKSTATSSGGGGTICLPYHRMLPLVAAASVSPFQPQFFQRPENQPPYPSLPMLPPPPSIPQNHYYDSIRMQMMDLWKAKAAVANAVSAPSKAAAAAFGIFWGKGFPGGFSNNGLSPMVCNRSSLIDEAQLQHGQHPNSQTRNAEALFLHSLGGRRPETPPIQHHVIEKQPCRQSSPDRKSFSAFRPLTSANETIKSSPPSYRNRSREDRRVKVETSDDYHAEKSNARRESYELINVTDNLDDDIDDDIDDVDEETDDGERKMLENKNKFGKKMTDKNGNNSGTPERKSYSPPQPNPNHISVPNPNHISDYSINNYINKISTNN